MAIDKKTDDYHITRPPTQSRSQAFFQFLYNPRTHEVLGRTAKSWLQIIVFYIVLYSFLAGFFAGLLMVFFQTLNVEQPTWTMEASLIGTNPGLGFRPLHPSPDQTAIVFNSKDSKSVALWKKAVDDFLEPYYGGNSDDFTDCTYGSEPPKDKPCRFVVALDKCGKDNYGYDTNMPCIYLKVNKIFGWQPDCYPQTAIDDETLKDMPQTLKDKIKTLSTQAGSNNIWASCTTSSDSPTDNQNITLTYDGHFGFPNYYYPYSNQKNYRTPFIALQVHGLPDDVSVKVSCQLWANNINVDRQRRLGMTTFEMMSQTKA